MKARYIRALPNDIQRNIYSRVIQRIRFEKHQEYFRVINEEFKKNEFEDIVRLKLDELSVVDVKHIVFPELSDNIENLMYITKLMEHYETTSTMVYKNGRRYNIIGYFDKLVHCTQCNRAKDSLVNHREYILECKECKMNGKI